MGSTVGERRPAWPRALKALVSVAVVALLLANVNVHTLLERWTEIRPEWAALAVALVTANLGCQFARLRIGLLRAHPSVDVGSTLRAVMIGLGMGAVTPGRFGELGQVIVLPSGGRRRALGVLAVIRLYGFGATMTLGALSLLAMPRVAAMPRDAADVTAGIVLALAVAGVIVVEGFFAGSGAAFVERLAKRFAHVEAIVVGMRMLRWRDRARFGAWSILFTLVYLTQLVMLTRAFGGAIGWGEGIAAGAIATSIVALLPIAVGNIGVRETAAILVWRNLGIGATVAFNAAFVLFVLNVVLPGLAGFAWNFVRNRTSLRSDAS